MTGSGSETVMRHNLTNPVRYRIITKKKLRRRVKQEAL